MMGPWIFVEANLPRPLLDAFKKAGFQAPTPIQAQVWPILDQGWDVIGIAKSLGR
jgi:ATP-dependent RNA helicase RhlE